MAPSAEVRHTFHGYGEINSDLNADTGPARSRALSRFPLRQRVAPGFSRPALLTSAGEGFLDVSPGSRAVARAFFPAGDVSAQSRRRDSPGGARWDARSQRVGRLAGSRDSAERFSAVGLVESVLRAPLPAGGALRATAARSGLGYRDRVPDSRRASRPFLLPYVLQHRALLSGWAAFSRS